MQAWQSGNWICNQLEPSLGEFHHILTFVHVDALQAYKEQYLFSDCNGTWLNSETRLGSKFSPPLKITYFRSQPAFLDFVLPTYCPISSTRLSVFTPSFGRFPILSRLSILSCLWRDVDNAEISPEKARDLHDLVGEASLAGFFADGELTHTDFDFLHDGLAFSGVVRVP